MDDIAERPFLHGLDADDRVALEARARTRTYPKGATLFFEGDHTTDVFVMVSGQAKVVVTAKDGREVLLAIRDDGEIIGELSAIDGTPRSASVVAIDECTVLILTVAEFDALLDERPGIARYLLRAMAARLRQTSARQLELGVDDALSRVCRRLVEMAERYGAETDDGVLVDAPLSQQDMADWSGLSRQAVVKALKALRSLKWIDTLGGKFLLRDPAAVRARAEVSGDL